MSAIPHSRLLFVCVGVAIAVLYLWGLGGYGFLDPDEGMYAEIAREMLASGDWVVPRFNGVPYVEKPPLMYWLTAGTYAVLGASEFSARLWKVLPALGTVALTYGLGRRLFSERTGILSSLLLATTLGVFLFSRITQVDSLLVFAITLSAFGIVEAALRNPGKAWAAGRHAAWCFWLGIGIGAMSKGLPGIVFPLALLALWTLVRRETCVVRAVWSWGGIALALVLVVPWHVMAATKVPGFFEFYVVDNQLMRFLGGRAYVEDGTSLGTLPFLGVTLFALFPWAPHLAAALMALGSSLMAHGAFAPLKRWKAGKLAGVKAEKLAPEISSPLTFHVSRFTFHDPCLQFLIGWIVLVVGGFALSSFKLEYYALPAFPAMAILAAAFLADLEHRENPETSLEQDHPGHSLARQQASIHLLQAWTWVAVLGGLLFNAAVAWAWWAGHFTPQHIVRGLSIWATNYRVILEQGLPLPPVSPGYFSALLLGGGLMWTAGFASALGWLRRGQVVAATLVIALIGVGLCAMAASLVRRIEPHHSLKPLAQRLNGAAKPEDVLVHERGLEKGGGLPFYTGRHFLVLNGTRGDLEFGSRLAGHQDTFIGTSAFQDLWVGTRRVFLVTDLPRTRSAISTASNPAPVLLASTGTRWLYSNRMP